MSQKIDTQNFINATVKQLQNAVNNSLVTYEDIARAFLQVHPYLLNEIAKGICSAVNTRKQDGRINVNGITYILNE